jgi:hypothetical protein
MKSHLFLLQSITLGLFLLSSCDQADNSKRYKGITRVVKKLKGDEETKKPYEKPEETPKSETPSSEEDSTLEKE